MLFEAGGRLAPGGAPDVGRAHRRALELRQRAGRP
ncbi:hypothetical protein GA0115236_12788, partial [Streptomyces sp. IgraMP-1]